MNLLKLDITNGPVVVIAYWVSVVLLLVLLVRAFYPWRSKRVFWNVASATIGLGVAFLLIAVLFTGLDAFDGPLEHRALPWVLGGFAALGFAVRCFWIFRRWFKILPALAILSILISTTLGVNFSYGLTPTLGLFLGLPTTDVVALPGVTGPPQASIGSLKSTWVAPADLPSRGIMGRIPGGIPATQSGFDARAAEIYLPPAALVKNPPKLPLIVWMMGKPGYPDPQFIARELETFAAKNNGLAPIVIAVDQLGDPSQDPLCLNNVKGNVETYFTSDVTSWAQANLNITTDPSQRVISGYSNGGACAIYFGAKYPQIWGNILAVSGVEYPGYKDGRVLKKFFNGSQAAWDAVKPATILSATTYANSAAVFTFGALDTMYGPGVVRVAEIAGAAGMKTTVIELPGIDHTNDALIGGLAAGLAIILPRLGL